MSQVLTMSNGKPETILSPKDFEDLVDTHAAVMFGSMTQGVRYDKQENRQ